MTGAYVLADSADLPFPGGCFDLAVAYNSLQVVADMPGTVREAAGSLSAVGQPGHRQPGGAGAGAVRGQSRDTRSA